MINRSRSLLGPFEHVWSRDPAIDTEHTAFSWGEYLRTCDRRHLPLREGEEFTVFHLRSLSRKQLQEVMGVHESGRPTDALVLAVAYALERVERWQLADGTMLEVKRQQGSNGEQRCTQPTIDALHDLGLLAELGVRVIERSRLNP